MQGFLGAESWLSADGKMSNATYYWSSLDDLKVDLHLHFGTLRRRLGGVVHPIADGLNDGWLFEISIAGLTGRPQVDDCRRSRFVPSIVINSSAMWCHQQYR
jgi:hypothetical protein